MRFSSFLLAITTLALTVSASTMDRRAETETVKECVKGIDDIAPLLDTVSMGIATLSSNTTSTSTLLADNSKLELALRVTTTICCTTAVNAIGADDSNATFKTLATLVPSVEATLKAIGAKSKEVKENNFVNGYVTSLIPELSAIVDDLKKCLVDRAPLDKNAEAKDYGTRITTAFAEAKAAYPKINPTADSAPTVGADAKAAPPAEMKPATEGATATTPTGSNPTQ